MMHLETGMMLSILLLLLLGVAFAAASKEESNEDLNALLALKGNMNSEAAIFSSWDSQENNAPCSWKYVYCSSNKRVISLDLAESKLFGSLSKDIGKLPYLINLNMSNNHLIGVIPIEIGDLSQLQILDLHNNNLNGSIPSTLAKLINLVVMNLSYNELTGVIPSGGPFLKLSDSSFKGNQGLHHDVDQTNSSETGARGHIFKSSVVIVIVLVSTTIASLSLAAFITWWRRPKVFSQLVSEKSGIALDGSGDGIRKYTLPQLRAATRDFCESNVIGQSSCGIVYKGCMEHGQLLAIKRLTRFGRKANCAFKGGVEVMSKAKHKNVAKLLGFCCTFREQILVYEHLPNGSLDVVLHGQWQGGIPLQWEKRKAIILGVAKGLSYLHGINPPIVHGALKASNVLLQMDYTPKITDYCIGHPMECTITSTSDIDLTQGYMAPELINSCQPTSRSDCYSFGFLLVEIVTGKRPWQLVEAANDVHLQLREWVMASYQKDSLQSLVDKELQHTPAWEVKKILELAVICLEGIPTFRPCMKDVVQFLVEEVLIANKSTELDGLFIELVIDPEYDGFHLQTTRPRVNMTQQSAECSFSKARSPLHASQRSS